MAKAGHLYPPFQKPDSSDPRCALQPFTRDVADWRVPRPLKTDCEGPKNQKLVDSKKVKTTHYIPRGERSTWTHAQYTVYKEEKAFHKREQWKKRKSELKTIAKAMNDDLDKQPWTVRYYGRDRTVLDFVVGRLDGEPAKPKDERGLPLPMTPEGMTKFGDRAGSSCMRSWS